MILLQLRLQDGGGFYAETNLNSWIVEPWNAISSLFFFLPVLYWLIRLRGRYWLYKEITLSLPFLFLGGLGSTLFHAFRVHFIFILLDVLPVLFLTVAVSIYFWVKILPKWYYVFGIILGYILFQAGLIALLPRGYGINVAYFLRGVILFLPMVLMLRKINFRNANLLFLAIAFFIMALIFRLLDKSAVYILPMGSHFLWHLGTVVGVFYLTEFMYRLINLENKSKENLNDETGNQEDELNINENVAA
jgi:hypothetical protein